MDKKELREKQIKSLKSFTLTIKKRQEDTILFDKLMSISWINQCRTFGVTASLNFEVDTSKLIANLWDEGKATYLAKITSDQQMHFLRYTYHSKLIKSKFGITEVANKSSEINDYPDILLVPGLAFDLSTRHRLGFGGGFYDRFLADHPKQKTVSLANSKMCFTKAIWPIEKNDIPVQKIITLNRII